MNYLAWNLPSPEKISKGINKPVFMGDKFASTTSGPSLDQIP